MRARLLIVVCVIAAFARALPYPLQRSWDDGRFLIDNPDVQHPSWAALRSFFAQLQFEAYHPLHLLSYWIDVPWAGPSPLVLHCVSLALWALAVCCVHALFLELGLSNTAAALGSLVCGLHPIQVEAVSWATGRKDVLALLFGATSLLWHLRSRAAWDRAAWYARGAFVLAALSKTTSLPLPLVACMLDVTVRRLHWRQALLRSGPSIVLAGVLGGSVMDTWQASEMVRTTLGGLERAPMRVCATFAAQLTSALWPARTSPMYATQAIASCGALQVAIVACFVGVIWVAQRRGAARVVCGLVAFALLMLPVSNLVPMYFPLQDRYLSLPILGLALAGAAIADHLQARLRVPGHALLVGVVLLLAARTVQYQGAWASEVRLWGHAASTQPDAEYAWIKLGETRRDAGDLEGAIAADRHLVRLVPGRKLAYAALLEVTALRDERYLGYGPSRARAFAQQLYAKLSDPTALRELAAALLAANYLRSVELPLAISLASQPLGDPALEHLALGQLERGHPSVARFYAAQMRSPTQEPALQAMLRTPSYRVLP